MSKHTKTRHALGWIYRGWLLRKIKGHTGGIGWVVSGKIADNAQVDYSVSRAVFGSSAEAETLAELIENVDAICEESTPQEYHGYTLTRSRNRNFRTPDKLWRVSINGVTVHRCSTLDAAQTYVDAAVKIDTYKQAREAIAAVEAKLGKGHELTCQRAIHTLGWDQDGEQAAELLRIYAGRA
jgi:hypothetical protein